MLQRLVRGILVFTIGAALDKKSCKENLTIVLVKCGKFRREKSEEISHIMSSWRLDEHKAALVRSDDGVQRSASRRNSFQRSAMLKLS